MSTKKSTALRQLEEIAGDALTFSSMLEAIRLADGLSQVACAKKLKISAAHLCDIEKGRKTVSPERAAKFAKVLGYSELQFIRLALQAALDQSGLNFVVAIKAA